MWGKKKVVEVGLDFEAHERANVPGRISAKVIFYLNRFGMSRVLFQLSRSVKRVTRQL